MPNPTPSDLVAREEIEISAREHPGISDDILREAIKLAMQRGGQTTPVSDYDILRARDLMAGEQSEVTRLTAELHASKDLITQQAAEIERLRDALAKIGEMAPCHCLRCTVMGDFARKAYRSEGAV